MKLLSQITLVSLFVTQAPAFAATSPQSSPPSSSPSSPQWRVTQPNWESEHEDSFGKFVTALGEAVEKRKCNRVDTCLKSSANIYYGTDPAGLKYYADCADLPYFLRGYFAWKNGLPFSMASEIAPSPLNTAAVKDVRYTPQGNIVTKRYDVIAQGSGKNTYPNALSILNSTIPNLTYSASFRMSGEKDSALQSDFYPTKMNRSAIRPGTVIYDPNGHVAIIYKVTADGKIFYIDAHPDNSLTMGLFTPKFSRSHPNQGAGFKNFRPQSLVGAQRDSTGSFIKGSIVAKSNSELPNFGTSQFYGTSPSSSGWNKGSFSYEGQKVNFYEFVRLNLSTGTSYIDPVDDLRQLVRDICTNLQDRVVAIEEARIKGLANQAHPARLPYNIFGTTGDWENYASPSRDARLKTSFVDLLESTKLNLEKHRRGDRHLRYSGGNLAAELFDVYAKEATSCQFSYNTSSGRKVLMNLEAARQRLFAMSFDPYHCIELRWGARMPQEMNNCRDDQNKRAWYNNQQWLRFQVDRTYEARMDFSLQELTGPKPGAGVRTPPDIDIVGYLKSQR